VRFVDAFLESADEVGLSADPAFRRRLRAYLEWGSTIARDVSQPGADVTSDEPVPVWGWGDESPRRPASRSATR
jgi:hemoglobin